MVYRTNHTLTRFDTRTAGFNGFNDRAFANTVVSEDERYTIGPLEQGALMGAAGNVGVWRGEERMLRSGHVLAKILGAKILEPLVQIVGAPLTHDFFGHENGDVGPQS